MYLFTITLITTIIIIQNTTCQNYEYDDESRRLGNDRRRRPNSNSNNPCGRLANGNNEPDGRFLAFSFINVEQTYNCGTGGHNNYGGGGGQQDTGALGSHQPQRPHKPHRPLAGLFNGGGSGGSHGGGGGLFSNLFSNGNNNDEIAHDEVVEAANNEPAPVVEQDKLPFFSNQLFGNQNNNNHNNNGLFFGLFDGSIINGYLNRPSQTSHNRPTTSQPEYTQTTNNYENNNNNNNGIKPVHEDYDIVTEAYSLNRPIFAKPQGQNPYSNLKPGQYITAYNPLLGTYDIDRIDNINPNRIIRKIDREFNKILNLF